MSVQGKQLPMAGSVGGPSAPAGMSRRGKAAAFARPNASYRAGIPAGRAVRFCAAMRKGALGAP